MRRQAGGPAVHCSWAFHQIPVKRGGGGGRKGCITQPRRLSDPSPFTRLHRALQGFGFTGHGKVKAGLKMASRKLDGEN